VATHQYDLFIGKLRGRADESAAPFSLIIIFINNMFEGRGVPHTTLSMICLLANLGEELMSLQRHLA